MSDLQKRIDETAEFINKAQDVIEKLNDTLVALNQLSLNRQYNSKAVDIAPAARESFEKEFRELVARHLNLDPSSEKFILSSQGPSLNQEKKTAARPGKYRSLV